MLHSVYNDRQADQDLSLTAPKSKILPKVETLNSLILIINPKFHITKPILWHSQSIRH